MKESRVIVPAQILPQILPASQVLVGVSYNVRTWYNGLHQVIVIDKDEHSVTLEYENDDCRVDRVPILYFTDELEACMVSRPLPRRLDYFRGLVSKTF